MPDNWENIATKVVEETKKSFIEKHKAEVDPEILQRYLELTYEEDLFYQILDETRPEITLSKNGELIFTFGMNPSPHMTHTTTRDKILEEFGYDVVTAIEKLVGDLAFEEDGGLEEEKVLFFEEEIDVTNDGKLSIMGVQVAEDAPELKSIRQLLSKDFDDDIAKTKEKLSKHLQNEEFEEVARLFQYLELLSNVKERENFAVDLISLLLKRTQVVTFSLPECLLYA